MNPNHRAAAERVAEIVSYRALSSIKSVESVVDGYRSDLGDTLQACLDGDLLTSEAKRRHKVYLKRDAEPAYLEGLAEGGGGDELDDDDKTTIADWTETQAEAVPGLWDDVQQAITDFDNGMITQKEYKQRGSDFRARLDDWSSQLALLGGLGRASAQRNVLCYWELGETEKHCRTCSKLDGSQHRLKWYTDKGYVPGQADSETLECGGWKCDCKLKRVSDDVQMLP